MGDCLRSEYDQGYNYLKSKGILHERNLHKGRYDLSALCESYEPLSAHITSSPRNEPTIDFSDPAAVLALNKALLKHYYGMSFWDIPKGYLCPPIPGRADYIHYAADLLLKSANKKNFKTMNVRALDIGTGANLIYPIVGSQLYQWQFIATDIDPVSINNAQNIVSNNQNLQPFVTVRTQMEPENIFSGVILKDDYFHISICNPPFFKTRDDAASARLRKIRNLNRNKDEKNAKPEPIANFGGVAHELYCLGGELAFVKQMILESADYGQQVGWFTSLVSNGSHVSSLLKLIQSVGVSDNKVIPMTQGNKSSRILAWTFKDAKKLKELMVL